MYKDGAKNKSTGAENGGQYDVEYIFTPGSIVYCKTCFGDEHEGEVLAFDYEKKVLLLKNTSAAQANHHDVQVLNLNYVSAIDVKQETKCVDSSAALPELNINKLQERCKSAIAERKALKIAFEAGVPPDGIKLYQALAKTMGQNAVIWAGKMIVVGDVSISPPYIVESCSPYSKGGPPKPPNQASINYVKQLVTRFWTEYKASQPAATAQQKNNDSTPSPPDTTTTNTTGSSTGSGSKCSSTGTRSPTSPKGRPAGGPATPPGATETSKPASPANVGGKPVKKDGPPREKGQHSPTGGGGKGKKNANKNNGQEK